MFEIMEAEQEILYHNSQSKLLYSQEVLKEGQYFKGKIYTRRKYAFLVKELLENPRRLSMERVNWQQGAWWRMSVQNQSARKAERELLWLWTVMLFFRPEQADIP